jgi:serine/threonine-protein kinase
MAPEQLLGSDLDARSDIFSFGAVLYEMLSGQPPFRGQTASEVVEAVLHGEPEMGALQAGSLRDLVVSCLRKNREERPRSAVALGRQLLPTSS